MSATYVITHRVPSANQLFRNVPGKGRVKTNRYKTWLTAAGWDIIACKANFVPTGDYGLQVTVPKAWGRMDLDNALKATVDLLVRQRRTPDDRHLVELSARYGERDALVLHVYEPEAA